MKASISTRPSFDRKVRDFADALSGAKVGVFFYAGHGLQVAGANYLVPVDAKLSTASALDWEMVRLDLVQRTMERETETNVLFLDACRDNPLARNLARAMGTRSAEIGRGLASTEASVGTLISFSTQPGNVALDGAGRNSPFAGALVKRVATSNDDLSALLIDVRNDVRKETQNKQVPWEHSALTGRFYFNPSAQTAAPPQVAPARLSEAAEAWGAAERATSVVALEAFITRYKDTFYAELARARIEELKKVAVAAPPTPAKPAQPAAAVTPTLQSGCVEAQVGNERKCLKAKDSFRDCPECPEMVVIPAGEFMMGSEEFASEKPVHKVTIAKALAVGKFEVTFAQWEACLAAGDCKHRPNDQGWGKGNRPVINMSWDDISKEYLPWLNSKTSKTYRLLSEAEWECAARAGSRQKYTWGDDVGRGLANCDGCGSQWDNKQTAPVGSFELNAFGLHDMHGNVWEWVADCWHENYQGAPADGSAWTTNDCSRRVTRGGSWMSFPRFLGAASRDWFSPFVRLNGNGFGFRLARTLD